MTKEEKQLFNRISEFQLECPILQRDKKGHNYKYTPLSTVIASVRPLLKKYKIGFTQMVLGEEIVTVIYATDIEAKIEIVTKLPSGYTLDRMNLFQSYGAMIAYYKRYVLTSALGIFSADEDTDASGKAVKVEPVKQPLNDKQFIQLLGAINSGAYDVSTAKQNWNLTKEQLETLNNL